MEEVDLYGSKKNKTKLSKGNRYDKVCLLYEIIDSNDVFRSKDKVWKAMTARHLERGCYMHLLEEAKLTNIKAKWKNPEFDSLYDAICYELYKAIDHTQGNTAYTSELCTQILNEDVDISTLGFKSALDLNNNRTIEAVNIIATSKGTPITAFQGSSHYRCKCGSSNTRTDRIHNRGLDEGTSKKVTCLVCGNSWSE